MIGPPPGARIWIAAGITDLRRGFTGLSAAVQLVLEQDPFARACIRASAPTGRSDQAAVVGWGRLVSVFEAFGTWPVHLAQNRKRDCVTDTSAIIHVAGRDRLGASGDRQEI